RDAANNQKGMINHGRNRRPPTPYRGDTGGPAGAPSRTAPPARTASGAAEKRTGEGARMTSRKCREKSSYPTSRPDAAPNRQADKHFQLHTTNTTHPQEGYTA